MNHLKYSLYLSSALPYCRFPFIPLPIPPSGGDGWAASFPPHYTGNICISVYRLNIHEGFRCRVDSRGRYRQSLTSLPPLPPILRPPVFPLFSSSSSVLLSSSCPPLYVQLAFPSSASVGDWLREQLRGMEEKHECHPDFCGSSPFPASLCVSRSRQVLLYQFLARRARRASSFIVCKIKIYRMCSDVVSWSWYRMLEKNLL